MDTMRKSGGIMRHMNDRIIVRSRQPMRTPAVQEQLQAIYSNHRQGLFTVALSITRRADRAEDAIHDAFARLCGTPAGKAEDAVAYAYRAVRNAAIDIVRKRSEPTIDLIERSDATGNGDGDSHSCSIFASVSSRQGDDPLVARESQALVRQAIEALPEAQREVLVMKLYAGLTFDRISAVLGEPLSTVASRYRRALDKLKEELVSLA